MDSLFFQTVTSYLFGIIESEKWSYWIRPTSSAEKLEYLTTSMWTTMTLTGLLLTSILFVFVSFKVGRSISYAHQTDPISASFLFSVSGMKYVNNHVKHTLFQTPLIPRRRFNSLSTGSSWWKKILSSPGHDLTDFDNPDKASKTQRRMSSSIHSSSNTSNNEHTYQNVSRRFSVQQKSTGQSPTRAKRNSMPFVTANQESPKVEESLHITSNKENVIQKTEDVLKTELHVSEKKRMSTRRNTLHALSPNLPIEPQQTQIPSAGSQTHVVHHTSTNLKPITDYTIIEEEETQMSLTSDVELGTLSRPSSPLPTMEEPARFPSRPESPMKYRRSPSVVERPTRTPIETFGSHNSFRQPSGKVENELNSGASTPSFTPPHRRASQQTINRFNEMKELTPPPGFSKKALAPVISEPEAEVVDAPANQTFAHQPLYARRRTESKLSSFFTPDPSPPASPRSNSLTPPALDVFKTDDLFGPISWGSPDKNESMRRAWTDFSTEQSEEPLPTVRLRHLSSSDVWSPPSHKSGYDGVHSSSTSGVNSVSPRLSLNVSNFDLAYDVSRSSSTPPEYPDESRPNRKRQEEQQTFLSIFDRSGLFGSFSSSASSAYQD